MKDYDRVKIPRVALLGMYFETNRFSHKKHVFRKRTGEEILVEARITDSGICSEMKGFVTTMDETGSWHPMPFMQMDAGDAGALDQAVFEQFLEESATFLRSALPLDAVFLAQHLGGITNDDEDSDGTLIAFIRDIVGPETKIVVTSDLHGSVSDKLFKNTDILVTYVTNPHVDEFERGAEAANLLREVLGGIIPSRAFCRVPMLTWQIPQETVAGNPFGDLVNRGHDIKGATPGIMNISIFASFAATNVPKVGVAIIVTTRGDAALAEAVTLELAALAWETRARYTPNFATLEEATRLAAEVAVDSARQPLLFVDFADNAGGGAGSNTVYIFDAFRRAGVRGALFGVQADAGLVAAAEIAGEGNTFRAIFNESAEDRFAARLEADAKVMRLTDGAYVAQINPKGREMAYGRSCLLEIDGNLIACVSEREQVFSVEIFEHFGLDVKDFRLVVVKSRLHYKAGFKHIFSDERIIEVDVPGGASPILTNWNFDRLARPIYPFDMDMAWEPALIAAA